MAINTQEKEETQSKARWSNRFFCLYLAHKYTILAGIAGMLVILIYVIVHKNLYFDPELELVYGKALFTLSILGAFLVGAVSIIRIRWNDRIRPWWNGILFFLMPVITMLMTECINSKFIYNFSPKTFFVNYILYLAFYMIGYLFSGSYKIPILVINPGLYLCALVNYYVELFRGSPFIPTDLLSMGTGLGVADGYEYDINCFMILASIIMIFTLLVGGLIYGYRFKSKKTKLLARVYALIYLVIFGITFYGTEYLANWGYKPDFWNQSRGYHKTGALFNFCLNTKYLIVSTPDGYDAEAIPERLYTALENAGVDPNGDTSIDMLTGENTYTPTDYADGELPNIICIMNESLSDLSLMGDLETTGECLPFINSLEENTIKGNLFMPVNGAGTSNSEYEFLTGNTISFLPSGSNVYQSYINEEKPSLVSTMESLGYSRLAYHPYYGEGWKREIVYPLLGFEDFISIEDFIDEDILETYKANNDVNEYEDLLKERYPDKDMLLRRFVSDSYDYTMVEEMYENRDTSKPFFIFNVTMQNHGGYAVDYRNFYKEIHIKSPEGDFPMATRYVSLVKRSDEAFEELVNYFSQVDEPTIICMFGDHQPYLEDEFFEKVIGTPLDELSTEQQQSRYMTPFVIWANYDIEEATIDKMSANYLSTLLLQAAGLELTDYNKYLANLYQTLPVIDTTGYIDADSNYYTYDEASEYDDLLNEYNQIIYYNMFEKENSENIFRLNNTSDQE